MKLLVPISVFVCWIALPLGLYSQTTGVLPLPLPVLPPNPPLQPAVITAGGNRLLLADTGVQVSFDASTSQLQVNRPGWWLVNYPLERIRGLEGQSRDDISRLLFGVPAGDLRNWYIKGPGAPAAEPAAPTGPAPIDLAPQPGMIVDNRAANASDSNVGTEDAPLRTIGAAVRQAIAGTSIRVHPGIYREQVLVSASGTKSQPIRIEGVRDERGALPVISGNDEFPRNAWSPSSFGNGVYRADLFTGREGSVTSAGVSLIERNWPGDLKTGEYAFNRGSLEFLNLRFDGNVTPADGQGYGALKWRRVQTDNGFLDLWQRFGPAAQNSVFWLSTYIWIPAPVTNGLDPALAQRVISGLRIGTSFRAFRVTGLDVTDQGNPYRMWLNGKLLPGTIYSSEADPQWSSAHADRNFGDIDNWQNVTFTPGWNHLVIQLDTSVKPGNLRFGIAAPLSVGDVSTSAVTPQSPDQAPDSPVHPLVTEYLALGPFPSTRDIGVYVRLPGDANPNNVPVDLASTRPSELLQVDGEFVSVRGFELRNGSQFQQRSQVLLNGQGDLLEGNILRDSEVGAVTCSAAAVLEAAPIVIRNNWIVNPGNVGVGCIGTSDQITPANVNDPPGRSAVWIEHNMIVNANWGGYDIGWSAGGSKSVLLTGAIIRYNTVAGGSGPGIWLDWENYGNRIEGNRFVRVLGYAVGIEASPGPNLIANNVAIGVRPGPTWLRGGILSWDSAGTWAVNNTVDGEWNLDSTWNGYTGTVGIDLGRGGDRQTHWGPFIDPEQVYLNNLVIGCGIAINPGVSDLALANFTDTGTGALPSGSAPDFRGESVKDYRLTAQSPLNFSGAENSYSEPVKHDHFGLLRLPAFGRTVGAFRMDPPATDSSQPLIEVELASGQLLTWNEVRR